MAFALFGLVICPQRVHFCMFESITDAGRASCTVCSVLSPNDLKRREITGEACQSHSRLLSHMQAYDHFYPVSVQVAVTARHVPPGGHGGNRLSESSKCIQRKHLFVKPDLGRQNTRGYGTFLVQTCSSCFRSGWDLVHTINRDHLL